MPDGWNIWGRDANRVRQFSVAVPDENEAIAVLTRAFRTLEILSRHRLDADLIRHLGIPEGRFWEWVPHGQQGEMRPGGEPIDRPMPLR